MANPLLTGVSGLNAHQQMLEVIGHNLANMNTTAYKARTAIFSELFYENIRSAAGGTPGIVGGINPSQVGTGSRVSQIDINLTQGNFESTGNELDLAIDGNGYFVVRVGEQQLYTRVGVFRVDENGFMVDPATGSRVQRFGSIGEPDGVNPAFQTPGNADIQIPFGAIVPGRPTESMSVVGNLPSTATGPLAETLQMAEPLRAGGVAATGATLLNDLDSNTVDYAAPDVIVISGTDANGAPVSVNFSVDGSTTVGNLLAAINGAFAGSTATLQPDGRISFQADTTGPAFLSLTLRDGTGNTGATSFADQAFLTTVEGKASDVVRNGLQIYDERGGAHTVELEFAKQADGSWSLTANLPAGGTVIDGSVAGIRFADNGTFTTITGTGLGDAAFTFQFDGQANPQTIRVNLGTGGTFDGLTSLAGAASLSANQDGSTSGSLVSVRVDGDGILEGVASNGRRFPLAQLAVAYFANPNGLEAVGENYFDQSVSSGDLQLGTARSGGRGSIRAGELEQSNVDLAFEFTRLIVAQRGFSANARTITVADEILEELTNLIR